MSAFLKFALLANALALAVFAGMLLSRSASPVGAAGGTIVSPDPVGTTGRLTSLELDASGNPVVSYVQLPNTLKVLHCGNPACTSGNSVFAIDSEGDLATENTSLALDSSGNPLVTFAVDPASAKLKLLRCGNPTCSSGNTIITLASTDLYSIAASLVLDTANKPVVSFTSNDGLVEVIKVLRCGDPACTASMAVTIGLNGWANSLALDALGNPVVAHEPQYGADLVVIHCGNPDCTAGNTTATPGFARLPSLALDASSSPVISYSALGAGGELRVLRCGNPACSAGNTTSSVAPPVNESSIALDTSGYPVVSYYDRASEDLRVLHCNDVACAGGDESITSPDAVGNVGEHSSLELDTSGNPVVSYYDQTNGDLRVLHCSDPNCSGIKVAPTPKPTATPGPIGPLDFSIGVDTDGNGSDDCTTHPAGPATCFLAPGNTFFVKVYVNNLGGVAAYAGYDAALRFVALIPTEVVDFAPWPPCAFPASAISSYRPVLGFSCAAFGPGSTYIGLLGRAQFSCTSSGTIDLIHGIFNTAIVEADRTVHPEAPNGSESLEINCNATSTPTPSPTHTPTPGPAVGGVAYDPGASGRTGLPLVVTLLGVVAVAIAGASFAAIRHVGRYRR